jgi:hypothetical protein
VSTPQDLARENAVLKERIAKLSSAALRVASTLDVNGVLREIVESARALSDARYGLIVTTDVDESTLEFVTSGVAEEEEGADERFVVAQRNGLQRARTHQVRREPEFAHVGRQVVHPKRSLKTDEVIEQSRAVRPVRHLAFFLLSHA